jgi:hypothetical protein
VRAITSRRLPNKRFHLTAIPLRSATRLNRAVLTPLMKKLSGKFFGILLKPETNVTYDAFYKWITFPEEYPTLQMGFGDEGGTSWGMAPSGAK